MINLLDQKTLRELVSYDPETGEFRWLVAAGRRKPGDPVGWREPNGYLRTELAGEKILLHQAAWLYITGQRASGLDHVDGVRDNNRFRNLRDVSHQVNCQNRRMAQINNRLGLLGVRYHKGAKRFAAAVTVNGRNMHLGLFDTSTEAHAAYLDAKRRLHEGCTL